MCAGIIIMTSTLVSLLNLSLGLLDFGCTDRLFVKLFKTISIESVNVNSSTGVDNIL